MGFTIHTRAGLTAAFLMAAGCSSASTGETGTGGGGGTGTGGATGTGGTTSGTGGTTTGGGTTSLNDGYKKATWGAGVTITYGNCTLRYQSNGIPDHARDAQYAVPNSGVMVPDASSAHAATDPTKAQTYDVTFSTCPTAQAAPTTTSLGNIGYMISGASLFNPYEGDGSTVALASNFSVLDASNMKVYFVDGCNGHPTPMGQYHYHGLPACVTAEVDEVGGASHLIGIALDGFPVYGNVDINGKVVDASQLDMCNGITSPTPEFPEGVYHYVLPDTTDASSSLRCYTGKPATVAGGGMGPPGGGPPGGGMPGGVPAEAAAVELSPCGSSVALSQRDEDPMGRVWAGVARSFRDLF